MRKRTCCFLLFVAVACCMVSTHVAYAENAASESSRSIATADAEDATQTHASDNGAELTEMADVVGVTGETIKDASVSDDTASSGVNDIQNQENYPTESVQETLLNDDAPSIADSESDTSQTYAATGANYGEEEGEGIGSESKDVVPEPKVITAQETEDESLSDIPLTVQSTTQAPNKTKATSHPAKSSVPVVKSGWYTIKSMANKSYGIYVKNPSNAKAMTLILKKGARAVCFAYKIKRVGSYYRIYIGVANKKSIEILGVKDGSGGVVSIKQKNNRSTLFRIKYDASCGGYRFVNVKTKLALSVRGGKAKNGAKIIGAKENAGAKSQLFALSVRPGLIEQNVYSLHTVQSGKRALTAVGGKGSFYTYTRDSDQKWYIAPIAGKKNVYSIECISTGKRLTGVKDARVQIKGANNANKDQWWVPIYGEKGIVWKNYATKLPLSTREATCSEGSKALNRKYTETSSREFKMTKRTIVESGIYYLVSGANTSLVLEVANGKTSAGAIAELNTCEAKQSEKWIYDASNKTLKNLNSSLNLEAVAGGNDSKIVQASATGGKNQKWLFKYVGNGKYQIVSGLNGGLVVSAVANATAAATNSRNKMANTQKWNVRPTTSEVQPKGFRLIKSIVNNGHGSLQASYVVIHETANPGATAKNHRDLWAGDGYYSDYAVHYVLDWTGDCYYCVPENRLCWQVGNGNKYVVGIELCHATNASDFRIVWNGGVQWAAWQLKKNGWGIDKLISHNECRIKWGGTDHTDPDDYFESFGKTWSQFKSAVKKALASY